MNEFISSRTNPKIKALLSIQAKPSDKAFLVEGFHLTEMAYEEGCLLETYGTKDEGYPNVPHTKIAYSVLEKVAVSKTPEGIVGVARLKEDNRPLSDHALLLENVQDPGNVGTLLRTALSFGYKDVILVGGCASPLKSKVVAASQGAIFKLRIIGLSLNEVGEFAKRNGYELIATTLKEATFLGEFKFPKRHILALGNEGQGISRELLEICPHKVKIEMEGIDSLNVGIAGGIAMYQGSRQ